MRITWNGNEIVPRYRPILAPILVLVPKLPVLPDLRDRAEPGFKQHKRVDKFVAQPAEPVVPTQTDDTDVASRVDTGVSSRVSTTTGAKDMDVASRVVKAKWSADTAVSSRVDQTIWTKADAAESAKRTAVTQLVLPRDDPLDSDIRIDVVRNSCSEDEVCAHPKQVIYSPLEEFPGGSHCVLNRIEDRNRELMNMKGLRGDYYKKTRLTLKQEIKDFSPKLKELKKKVRELKKINYENVKMIDEEIYKEANERVKSQLIIYNIMRNEAIDCKLFYEFHKKGNIEVTCNL